MKGGPLPVAAGAKKGSGEGLAAAFVRHEPCEAFGAQLPVGRPIEKP